MKTYRLVEILCFFALAFAANGYLLVRSSFLWLIAIIPLYLIAMSVIGFLKDSVKGLRLLVVRHGAVALIMTLAVSVVTVVIHIPIAITYIPEDYMTFVWSAIWAVVAIALLFWNGIICVYLTSGQLGVKWRVLGIVFGLVPIINMVLLGIIIERTLREVEFESFRIRRNEARREEQVTATRYPILLVHGFFFRDWALFNYWGRIPEELKRNGATVYYGQHQSARPVPDSAKELARRIRDIIEDTGCEKVNIIAHSKGGLDCRYAMEHLGIAPMVASLTTVNTPHRGCIFADELLTRVPESIQSRVAAAYNRSLTALGDTNPDFLAAARDLTASVCIPRDEAFAPPEGVFCQSFGSRQVGAISGRFPLNLSYHLVRHYDGPNDGLVAISSFAYGERFTLLEPPKGRFRRGISHGDVIDLNRENIPHFDVREFYVGLVSDLKRRGL